MEIGKNWLLTNQKIELEEIEYLWVVEPGACETCLALDGTVYESSNDIPIKPHPNCKCHILPIEKDVLTTDPIELYKKKRREEQRNELLLAKLYGDALSLEQEIDEYNNRIDELEEDIEEFEQDVESYIKNIDKPNIEEDEEDNFQGQKGYIEISHYTNEEVNPKLDELKNQVDYAKYKGEKAKKEVSVLKKDIHKSGSSFKEISKLEFEIIKLQSNFTKLIKSYREIVGLKNKIIDNVIQKINNKIPKNGLIIQLKQSRSEYKGLDETLQKEKFIVDTGVYLLKSLGEDAASLWVLASSKFTRGLDYIKNNNGKIIDKVSDLKNKELEEIVRKKLDNQIQKQEARGLWLPANSTLAKSLANSPDFKRILNEQNRPKILLDDKKEILEIKTSIGNNLWTDTNNYLAIHGCDILNVRVEDDILYATILDTVDYNKGDFKVKLPRDLQESGAIENYYILIEIAEPIGKLFAI